MSTPPPPNNANAPIDLTYSPEIPLPHPFATGPPLFLNSPTASPEAPYAPRKRRRVSFTGPDETDVKMEASVDDSATAGPSRSDASSDTSTPIDPPQHWHSSTIASTSTSAPTIDPPPAPAPTKEPKKAGLAEYTCPICFSAPKDATLTPCGHIMCGSCLFGAVRAARTRALASAQQAHEAEIARCPICRAVIGGWDGRGGGVIGLEVRGRRTTAS